MKKLSFTFLLAAALCFAACGNNTGKKAEAAAVETECSDSCCGDAAPKTKSDCGGGDCGGCDSKPKTETGCGGGECGGCDSKPKSRTEAGCGGNCQH